MALRQKLSLPGFEWHLQEELKRSPALRAPHVVQFRRRTEASEVAQQLVPYNYSRLEAPMGSGKSIRIPKALASLTKGLVFHVLPNRQLVGHLFSYLKKLETEVGYKQVAPTERFFGNVEEVPRNGVYLLAAVDMVDLMAWHGGLTAFKGCTVYLDEAHQSDAYTYVVKSLALTTGAERLVLSSATFDPTRTGMVDTPGGVKMVPVDLGPPEEWEVDNPNSPFHTATLVDGIWVFIDSRSAARQLGAMFERAGLDVFRLTASSSDQEVSAAFRAAGDSRGCQVAILADSSYRDGFNVPLSRAVDTGDISYYSSVPGEFKRLTRRMFLTERDQSANRFGRIDSPAVYYYQKGECPAMVCDLEGVEKEAAAYIFRCLGYEPNGLLSSAVMAEKTLPEGVSVRAALNGPYPLTYYVKNAEAAAALPKNEYKGPAVAPGRVDVERMVVEPPSYAVSQGVAKGVQQKPEFTRADSAVDLGAVSSEEKRGVPDAKDRWNSVLDRFIEDSPDLVMQDGVYYVSQVRDSGGRGVMASMTFPGGLHSVREFARKKNFEFAVQSVDREDRMWAFSLLLDRYNTVTAQLKGAKAAVEELNEQGRSPSSLDNVRDVLEELSAEHADALACLRAAQAFSMSPCWAVPYDGVLRSESTAKEAYLMQFTDKHSGRTAEDLEGDIGPGLADKMRRVSVRGKERGRGGEVYEGRRKEVLAPAWAGGKRVTYAEEDDDTGRHVKTLSRRHHHDDDDERRRHHYTVRRYRKVTTWS